jgi:hypothetical protein
MSEPQLFIDVKQLQEFSHDMFPVEDELLRLLSDAGWLEIHLACQAALALWDRNGKAAAYYLTKLRSLPESRVQAMVIAKLNTIIDKINHRNDAVGPLRLPFRRRP